MGIPVKLKQDGDVLREGVRVLAKALMAAEVTYLARVTPRSESSYEWST